MPIDETCFGDFDGDGTVSTGDLLCSSRFYPIHASVPKSKTYLNKTGRPEGSPFLFNQAISYSESAPFTLMASNSTIPEENWLTERWNETADTVMVFNPRLKGWSIRLEPVAIGHGLSVVHFGSDVTLMLLDHCQRHSKSLL